VEGSTTDALKAWLDMERASLGQRHNAVKIGSKSGDDHREHRPAERRYLARGCAINEPARLADDGGVKRSERRRLSHLHP